MSSGCSIVWLRQDLRLADNPALTDAARRGLPVLPVYIWAPEEEGPWPPGAASRWWLHHSLTELHRQFQACGSRLVIRRGPGLQSLRQLAQETGAARVLWNRRYEPAARTRDEQIKTALRNEGLEVASHNSTLLCEPWTIQNRSGKPFQVFTPFWKTCLAANLQPPCLPTPPRLPAFTGKVRSLAVGDLDLLPKINWAAGLAEKWRPGEAGAQKLLRAFTAEALAQYEAGRNLPAIDGTSGLSPHLHFGEISPRQIWRAVAEAAANAGAKPGAGKNRQFLAELGWREFAYHLLFHFPQTPERPLRSEFEKFPWRPNHDLLKRWQQGVTGIPLVDAGMRQLWHTGWMHNRVRMVVGSFLVKNLLLPWQDGARWFWDTLVDADLASNTLGWQWVAGCGADAAPFFRIFNPVTQGQKFDPKGDYTRRWVPELRLLPDPWVHQPWAAPPAVLAAAGITPGKTYPEPATSLYASRETALAAYRKMRAQ